MAYACCAAESGINTGMKCCLLTLPSLATTNHALFCTGKSVADLGCGIGDNALYLARWVSHEVQDWMGAQTSTLLSQG